jgi:DNA-binding response OmpR family regulator
MNSKILIIEDDKLLGDLIRTKLATAGYEVELVSDGKAGLERIKTIRPDLVLLDIVLPTMNGYEVLEGKFADDAIRDIPVIIVSNSGQPVEISRAVKLGAKDYIVKAQVDPNEVLEKVKEHLSDANMRTSLAGKRILSIEDDRFLSEIMIMKLLRSNCVTQAADTGEKGLEEARTFKPDVILLDLILPGISGFDVLAALKSDSELKNIPVIVLSNLGQREEVDRAMALGAAKYLVKAMSTPTQIYAEIVSLIAQ